MSIAHKFKDKIRTHDVLISESVDFSGLLLSDGVLRGLTESGFKRPSPIQLKAIPLGRCGLDLIVQAKSGTGKTCVFTVVALESLEIASLCVQVLVLAPTREIAVQIQEVMHGIGGSIKGLKCHTFIGGLPLQQDKLLTKSCHIAVGTPGRVKQLIELEALKTSSIRLFVLDEADKLLEESFQETINWIYSKLPVNKQILALSATYPEYLAQHLTAYMRNPTFVRLNITDPALLGVKQYHVVVPNHPMPNIVYSSKTEAVVKILSSVSFQQCLIFSNMQTRAQNLQSELQSRSWPTACIAGCLDQNERNFAMQQLKMYKCRILISTDLTSRGIDADKVNLVINLDVPPDHETYLHRIGRAGRYGSFGVAVTVVTKGSQEAELWSVEKKCSTYICKLPDPIPSDLITRPVPVQIDDIVSAQQIINQPTCKMEGGQVLLTRNKWQTLPDVVNLVANGSEDLQISNRNVASSSGDGAESTRSGVSEESVAAVSDLEPEMLEEINTNSSCVSASVSPHGSSVKSENPHSSACAQCHQLEEIEKRCDLGSHESTQSALQPGDSDSMVTNECHRTCAQEVNASPCCDVAVAVSHYEMTPSVHIGAVSQTEGCVSLCDADVSQTYVITSQSSTDISQSCVAQSQPEVIVASQSEVIVASQSEVLGHLDAAMSEVSSAISQSSSAALQSSVAVSSSALAVQQCELAVAQCSTDMSQSSVAVSRTDSATSHSDAQSQSCKSEPHTDTAHSQPDVRVLQNSFALPESDVAISQHYMAVARGDVSVSSDMAMLWSDNLSQSDVAMLRSDNLSQSDVAMLRSVNLSQSDVQPVSESEEPLLVYDVVTTRINLNVSEIEASTASSNGGTAQFNADVSQSDTAFSQSNTVSFNGINSKDLKSGLSQSSSEADFQMFPDHSCGTQKLVSGIVKAKEDNLLLEHRSDHGQENRVSVLSDHQSSSEYKMSVSCSHEGDTTFLQNRNDEKIENNPGETDDVSLEFVAIAVDNKQLDLKPAETIVSYIDNISREILYEAVTASSLTNIRNGNQRSSPCDSGNTDTVLENVCMPCSKGSMKSVVEEVCNAQSAEEISATQADATMTEVPLTVAESASEKTEHRADRLNAVKLSCDETEMDVECMTSVTKTSRVTDEKPVQKSAQHRSSVYREHGRRIHQRSFVVSDLLRSLEEDFPTKTAKPKSLDWMAGGDSVEVQFSAVVDKVNSACGISINDHNEKTANSVLQLEVDCEDCVSQDVARECVSQDVARECVSQDVARKCVSQDVARECVGQDVARECVSQDVARKCVSQDVARECVGQDVARECVSQDVARECVSQDVARECVGQDVARECVSQDVARECVSQDVAKNEYTNTSSFDLCDEPCEKLIVNNEIGTISGRASCSDPYLALDHSQHKENSSSDGRENRVADMEVTCSKQLSSETAQKSDLSPTFQEFIKPTRELLAAAVNSLLLSPQNHSHLCMFAHLEADHQKFTGELKEKEYVNSSMLNLMKNLMIEDFADSQDLQTACVLEAAKLETLKSQIEANLLTAENGRKIAAEMKAEQKLNSEDSSSNKELQKMNHPLEAMKSKEGRCGETSRESENQFASKKQARYRSKKRNKGKQLQRSDCLNWRSGGADGPKLDEGGTEAGKGHNSSWRKSVEKAKGGQKNADLSSETSREGGPHQTHDKGHFDHREEVPSKSTSQDKAGYTVQESMQNGGKSHNKEMNDTVSKNKEQLTNKMKGELNQSCENTKATNVNSSSRENKTQKFYESKDDECKLLDDMHAQMLARRKFKKLGNPDFSSDTLPASNTSEVKHSRTDNEVQENIPFEAVKKIDSELPGGLGDEMNSLNLEEKVDVTEDSSEKQLGSVLVVSSSPSANGENENSVCIDDQECRSDVKERNLCEKSFIIPEGLPRTVSFSKNQEPKQTVLEVRHFSHATMNQMKPTKPSKSKKRLDELQVSSGSTSSTSDLSLSSVSDISDVNSSDLDNRDVILASQCYANKYAQDGYGNLKEGRPNHKEEGVAEKTEMDSQQRHAKHTLNLTAMVGSENCEPDGAAATGWSFPDVSAIPSWHKQSTALPPDYHPSCNDDQDVQDSSLRKPSFSMKSRSKDIKYRKKYNVDETNHIQQALGFHSRAHDFRGKTSEKQRKPAIERRSRHSESTRYNQRPTDESDDGENEPSYPSDYIPHHLNTQSFTYHPFQGSPPFHHASLPWFELGSNMYQSPWSPPCFSTSQSLWQSGHPAHSYYGWMQAASKPPLVHGSLPYLPSYYPHGHQFQFSYQPPLSHAPYLGNSVTESSFQALQLYVNHMTRMLHLLSKKYRRVKITQRD